MNVNTDNKAMEFFRVRLEKKLRDLDKQLEGSGKVFNTDDFKVLLGKHALAEELIHELQSAVS